MVSVDYFKKSVESWKSTGLINDNEYKLLLAPKVRNKIDHISRKNYKEAAIKRVNSPGYIPSRLGRYKKGSRRWVALNIRKVPKECEICKVSEKNLKKKLCLDHCHKTNRFRGWICHRCNFALGYARDNIEILKNMIEYLKSNQGVDNSLD